MRPEGRPLIWRQPPALPFAANPSDKDFVEELEEEGKAPLEFLLQGEH
jgi:hypothetical protein